MIRFISSLTVCLYLAEMLFQKNCLPRRTKSFSTQFLGDDKIKFAPTYAMRDDVSRRLARSLSACCGVPFLRTRPSVLLLELARNWKEVYPSWQPVLQKFSKSGSGLRDGESVLPVFSMHGSALGTLKGEGRSGSGCCRCRLLCRPLVRQSFQLSPGPTTAVLPIEVKKTGSVALGNFTIY